MSVESHHDPSPDPELQDDVATGVFQHGTHDEKWAETTAGDAPFVRQALHKASTLPGPDARRAYLEGVADALTFERRLDTAQGILEHFDPDQELGAE